MNNNQNCIKSVRQIQKIPKLRHEKFHVYDE